MGGAGPDDLPVGNLRGIGPVMAEWLAEIDIRTEADLRVMGAPAAYRRLRHWGGKRVSRNALWGLHAALTGESWLAIPPETKARLLSEAGEL